MANTEIYAGGEGRELLHHVMLGSVYYCVEGEAERLRLHCNKNASCITALDRISPSIQPPTQKNHYDGYFQQMWLLQKVAIITIIFIQSVSQIKRLYSKSVQHL